MKSTIEATEVVPRSGRELAAELAARIPIPTRLPTRYDGQPLRHLSMSSYTKLIQCPERFRRRVILGFSEPTSAVVFVGRRVDEALSSYYRQILDTGERPELEAVADGYQKRWREAVEQEHAECGLDFSELDEATARRIGLESIAAAYEHLIPQLGEPVAVQRPVEFKLAAELEWTIVGYPDLETRRHAPDSTKQVSAVVDWKVKGDPIHQQKADRDVQAGLYLAARWLEGDPATEFRFAQMLRPGKRRSAVSASLTTTTRTVGQLRAVLARLALAASQIASLYERFGPERPWGFADPTSWQCSERYCPHWQDCPGGSGL